MSQYIHGEIVGRKRMGTYKYMKGERMREDINKYTERWWVRVNIYRASERYGGMRERERERENVSKYTQKEMVGRKRECEKI